MHPFCQARNYFSARQVRAFCMVTDAAANHELWYVRVRCCRASPPGATVNSLRLVLMYRWLSRLAVLRFCRLFLESAIEATSSHR